MLASNKKFAISIILSIVFVNYLSIGLIYPLFSSLLFDQNMHFLPTDASHAMRGFYLGLLLALMPLVQFFSSPFLGALSDDRGRKRVLVYCLLLAFTAYLVSVFAIHEESLILLIFTRILLGISGGSAAVVQASLVDISTQDEKESYFGLYNMALGAGYTIGPFVGGKLSHPDFFSIGNFSLPFWFSLFIITANLLLVIFFFRETLSIDERKVAKLKAGFSNLKKALYMPGVRVLFLSAFVFTFGWSFFFEFVPVYLIGKYAFKAHDIGNFYAYSGGVYALCCGLFIRSVTKRFSNSTILIAALLSSGVYILAFLLIGNSNYLWFYLPLLLFFIALVIPTFSTMISNQASREEQGEVLGIFQSVQSMAYALSPLFSGYLVGYYISMPIIMGSISILLSGAIFGLFTLSTYFAKRDTNI